MNPPVRPARVCYSVDLSARRLIVGRAQRRGRAVEFEVVADQSVAGGESVTGASALPTEGKKQANVSLAASGSKRERPLWTACVPVQESVARWLQAPLASIAKARKVLPTLLDIQLPFPLEDCVHQFLGVARVGPEQVEGLAVAARYSDIRARLAKLNALGFDPVILDHEGLALWTQSLRERPAQQDGHRVVALLGEDRSTVVVGHMSAGSPAGRFVGAHSIRPPAFAVEGAGPSGPHLDRETWATRVRQILQAQWPDPAQQRIEWAWTGPGAANEGLVRGLQDAMAGLGDFVFWRHRDPAFFLARALATRALVGGEWTCNFRRGPLVHPSVTQYQRSQQAQASLTLAVAGLILCGAGLVWPVILEGRKEAVQTALTDATKKLAPEIPIPRGQEVLFGRRALQEQADRILPFLNALQPPLEPLLADTLALARQHGFQLDSISLSSESVAVRGTAEDWDRCDLLAHLFRDRGYKVQVDREEAGLDEKVHFALKGAREP